MHLFLDTVRIANLLVEHCRYFTPFYWAIEDRSGDHRLDPPDPTHFRTDDGWILQTYTGTHGRTSLRGLICPWGLWFCFPQDSDFRREQLLPHLEFTEVPRKDLPYPKMPNGYLYVTHIDRRFLPKPNFVESVRTDEDWQRQLTEWNSLMERHGVTLPTNGR
ncbi:MAG: hypothetical protein ACM3NH_04915 [Candidatus Saccharibacteria bacterium]